jgi:hypothetical protein
VLAVTPLPSIVRLAPELKFVPLIVTFRAVPRLPVFGDSVVNVGTVAGMAVIVTAAVPTAEGDTALAA